MYKKIIFWILFLSFFAPFLYAQSLDKEMTLTLVIPQARDLAERQIFTRFDNKPNFHVLLKNTSSKPQKILQEACLSANEDLYFVLEVNGQKTLIRKTPKECTKNYIYHLTANPDEYIVFDIYITTDEWTGLPKVKEKTPAKIKAIYETKEAPTGKKDIWSGKIESQILDIIIYP